MKQAPYYLKLFNCGGGFIFERLSNDRYRMRWSTANVTAGFHHDHLDGCNGKWTWKQLQGYLKRTGNYRPIDEDELVFLLL